MRIRIFQINLDRDDKLVAFESYDNMKKYADRVEAWIYDKVWEGEVEEDDLEDVYRIFNLEKPDGYEGRSLSVSDVIEVVESGCIKAGYYYCDIIGFKEIDKSGNLMIADQDGRDSSLRSE